MRKYPTEYAYIVAIQSGNLVVGRVSKYNSYPCTKYPTREEAEAEIKRRNETNKNT